MPAAALTFFYVAIDIYSPVRPIEVTSQIIVRSWCTRMTSKDIMMTIVEYCSAEGLWHENLK